VRQLIPGTAHTFAVRAVDGGVGEPVEMEVINGELGVRQRLTDRVRVRGARVDRHHLDPISPCLVTGLSQVQTAADERPGVKPRIARPAAGSRLVRLVIHGSSSRHMLVSGFCTQRGRRVRVSSMPNQRTGGGSTGRAATFPGCPS
jgi:hypothetical protein